MEYVTGERKEGCVFCSAASDPQAPWVIFRGEKAFVMLNAYPYNSGHLLVVPYDHVPSIIDLDAEVLCWVARLTQAAMKSMERCLRPAGFNIGINIGKVAGAGIAEHVHVHVVPRWEGDTNFMSVVADTRVVPEALQAAAARLRPVLEQVCEEMGLEKRTGGEQL